MKHFVLFSVLIMTLISCERKDMPDNPNSGILDVVVKELHFDSKGGQQKVTVTANGFETDLDSDVTWCTITPTSSNTEGKTEVSVVVEANSGLTRQTELVIQSGKSKHTITITQDGELIDNTDMILGKNTILMSVGFIKHVTKPVVDMKIMLDPTVNNSDLPKQGQILLNLTSSELFPRGFLGKVSQVNKTDLGYEIATEKAYLDEAFDKLYVKETMEIAPRVSSPLKGVNIGDITLGLYSDEDYRGIQFEYKKEGLPHCAKNSYFTTELKVGFHFQYIIDINNKINKKHISFSLKNKFSLSPEIGVEYENKTNNDIYKTELTHLDLVPKAGAGAIAKVILNPEMVISLNLKAEGKLNINTKLGFFSESVVGVEYNNNKWNVGSQSYTNEQPNYATLKFLMEGSLFFGLECELKAKFFNEDFVSLSIPFNLGCKAYAEMSSDILSSTDYNKISNLSVTLAVPHISGEATVAILKNDDIGKVNIFERELLKSFNLFPKFENMTAIRNNQDKTELIVNSNVSNDLFVPVEIDYCITSKNGDVPQTRSWTTYHQQKNFSNPFNRVYSEFSKPWEYQIQPVIKIPIFGEIKASPIVVLEPAYTVETLGAMVGTGNVSLSGRFEPVDQSVTEYGICYSKTNTKPTLNDNHIRSNTHDQGNFFVTVPGTKKGEVYYYRSYIKAAGSLHLSPDVMSVEIKEIDISAILGTWLIVQFEGSTTFTDNTTEEDDLTMFIGLNIIINKDKTFQIPRSIWTNCRWKTSFAGWDIVFIYDVNDDKNCVMPFNIAEMSANRLTLKFHEVDEEGSIHNARMVLIKQ